MEFPTIHRAAQHNRSGGKVLRAESTAATPAATPQRCLTCGRDKPAAAFLVASLWPAALGGEAAPTPFRNGAICDTCRQLSELMVDGAFLQSWFMQAELARAALHFMDATQPGPAPLTYLGLSADFPVAEGEICERWAGLAGEAIFRSRPDIAASWAGYGRSDEVLTGLPDAGCAILVLASPSQYWTDTARASLIAHFPHARRCIVDDRAGTGAPNLEGVLRQGEHAFIRQRGNRQTVLNTELKTDHSQRFLVKLALGLGQSLFGAYFANSSSARRLRKQFWESFPRAQPVSAHALALHWPGAWALTLAVFEGVSYLAITTPTGRQLGIVISEDGKLWADAGHEALREGQCFIAIPQRGIFGGPWPLAACLAHCAGASVQPQLSALEALRCAPGSLPSRQGFA